MSILSDKPSDGNPFERGGSIAELFSIVKPLIERAKARELLLDAETVHGFALLSGFRKAADLDDALSTYWDCHEREYGFCIQPNPNKLYSIRAGNKLSKENWERSRYVNAQELIELGWVREARICVPVNGEK